MKTKILALSLAVLVISSCASNAPVPASVPMKPANVTISARLLGQWGYVALQVDSFLPRGPRARDMGEVSSQMTACDAYAAKAWLSALDFVDPDAIGVIGWSHGGIAVLDIIDTAHALQREVAGSGQGATARKMEPFNVAVAFYPYAHPLSAPDTSLLVLIGTRDDICPARLTRTLKPDYTGTGLEISLTTYPDVYHAFDVEAVGEHGMNLNGHHLQYDPQVTADALQRTRDFLRKYIGPGKK